MSESLADEERVYRNRLLAVAIALRESPNPDRFTMEDVLHECGTPGCAFGHYVYRTDLQDFVKPVIDTFVDSGRQYWKPVHVDNGEYAEFYGDRVRDHFGLTDREQEELFSASGCGLARSANQAAEYVEEFVARKYPQAEAV